MRFVTTHFRMPSLGDYDKLYTVFEESVRRVMPDVEIVQIRVRPPSVKKTESLSANHAKMKGWREYVETEMDDDTVFIDCDMLALGSVEHVFRDYDFDVAITKRNRKMPINGGVVFVRNTRDGKDFIRAWADADEELYANSKLHEKWRLKYQGMNQASFGYLTEQLGYPGKLIYLPCAKYNACSEDWKHAPEISYLVHCKAELKRALLSNKPVERMHSRHQPVAKIWRKMLHNLTSV